MVIKNYNHVLAVDDDNYILANVVYIVTKRGAIGSYFGYEGGQAFTDGYFLLEFDWTVTCSSDLSEFAADIRPTLDELASIRSRFESVEDGDDEGSINGDARELLDSDDGTFFDSHEEYWSENAEREVLEAVSAAWPLSFRWK